MAAPPASATSGPLPDEVSNRIAENELVVASVLSGNRNFEGRVSRRGELPRQPAAGGGLCDRRHRRHRPSPPNPIATDADGNPVHPATSGRPATRRSATPSPPPSTGTVRAELRRRVRQGDSRWNRIESPGSGLRVGRRQIAPTSRTRPSSTGPWGPAASTTSMAHAPLLGLFGDSITTDHISPAGNIKKEDSRRAVPAWNAACKGRLQQLRLARGNDDDVMVRGHLRQHPHQEPDVRRRGRRQHAVFGTTPHPGKMKMRSTTRRCATKADGVPLVVIAGKNTAPAPAATGRPRAPTCWGQGGDRESFERIHRSNLVGMGVLPLQFRDGQNASRWASMGRPSTSPACGTARRDPPPSPPPPTAAPTFTKVLLLTPKESEYFRHGGLLQYDAAATGAHKSAG